MRNDKPDMTSSQACRPTYNFCMRVPIFLLCLLIASCPVLAQEKGKGAPPPPKKMTEEQKRRALNDSCNREANSLKLKGKDRKSFMGGCLGEPAPDADKEKKPKQ